MLDFIKLPASTKNEAQVAAAPIQLEGRKLKKAPSWSRNSICPDLTVAGKEAVRQFRLELLR